MKASLRKKTVLVVEDDQDIRRVMAEVLELHGYAVVSAINGEDALTLLREPRPLPDVILLDLQMPVKDGYAFRLEQTADPRWSMIPVVTITADDDFIGRLEEAGCKAYLRKPVDLDELLGAVAKYSDFRGANY